MREHDIVHLSESAGRFLQFAGGEPTRESLARSCIRCCGWSCGRRSCVRSRPAQPAEVFDVPVEIHGEPKRGGHPGGARGGYSAGAFCWSIFEAHEPADGAATARRLAGAEARGRAQHLERELERAKAHLRDTVEQYEATTEELKASNEELQAMNEELRSASEELETSREELQSHQ